MTIKNFAQSKDETQFADVFVRGGGISFPAGGFLFVLIDNDFAVFAFVFVHASPAKVFNEIACAPRFVLRNQLDFKQSPLVQVECERRFVRRHIVSPPIRINCYC